MSRRRLGLLALGLLALVAALTACGGADAPGMGERSPVQGVSVDSITPAAGDAPEGSVNAILAEDPAPDVALVFGTGAYTVGENRITFLVLDRQGAIVESPSATVRVAKGASLDGVPTVEARAENLPVGLDPGTAEQDAFDAPSVYVANVELDEPGAYTLLVEPEGGAVQAVGSIEVAASLDVPAVGEAAPASDTPTVRDGFPEDITTARPPDVELLQHSIAESLADGVPFVVVFATPRFCQSRVCGPVVSIVDQVRRQTGSPGVRFVHVEIFENQDPQQGFNRWVAEWGLPSEPWTFLVGADGLVKARFEGLVTVGELAEAVERNLVAPSAP